MLSYHPALLWQSFGSGLTPRRTDKKPIPPAIGHLRWESALCPEAAHRELPWQRFWSGGCSWAGRCFHDRCKVARHITTFLFTFLKDLICTWHESSIFFLLWQETKQQIQGLNYFIIMMYRLQRHLHRRECNARPTKYHIWSCSDLKRLVDTSCEHFLVPSRITHRCERLYLSNRRK